MKDLSHHIKKFVRKVTRSLATNEKEELNWEVNYLKDKSDRQKKKQEKAARRKSKEARMPHPKDVDEKNREMKHRTPEIRKRSGPKT